MPVTADLIESGSVALTKDGATASRTFLVSGLTGAASARVYNALSASGIPVRGQVHPSIPGIYCDTINATTIDQATIIKVVATYKPLDVAEQPPNNAAVPQISVGGSVQTVRTNKDYAGTLMYVEHAESTTDSNGNLITITRRPPVEVDIQVPQVVLAFARKETSDPAAKAAAFVGCVNQAGWGPAGLNLARQWLCNRISGEFTTNGWLVNYEFQFAGTGKTWDADVVYIDPKTNQIPEGAMQGRELKTYQVYKEANFASLGI